MKAPTRGYWCECWTQDIRGRELPELKASFDAHSAPQADRWIAVALRTISPALDPDASNEAWEWLQNGRADTRRALLRMQPLHGDPHASPHPHHMDDPPRNLPATRPPPGSAAPRMRTRIRTALRQLEAVFKQRRAAPTLHSCSG